MKTFEIFKGRALKPLLPVLAALTLAACAQDGSSLIDTSALGQPAEVKTAQAKVDPQCLTLAQEIETLKGEGSTARLEKVADGKSPAVTVKRSSIAKQAQLNKANADFIAKCGPNMPRTAALAPQAAPAAAPAVAAAKATTGVTIDPPSAAKTISAPAKTQ